MKIYINNIFKNKNLDDDNKKENLIKNNSKKKHREKYKNIKTNINLNETNVSEYDNKLTKDNKVIKFEEYTNNYIRKGASNFRKQNQEVKNNKKNKKIINFNKYNLPKSYYTLLVFMILLAGVSVKLVINSRNVALEENYAVFNSNDDLLENKNTDSINLNQNINSSNLDTRVDFGKTESSTISTNTKVNNNVVAKVNKKINNVVQKKEEPLIFVKPCNGEISKIFSDDKVIYSKTLEMWKIHDGIDVKGEIGEVIYSIEKGTVEKIYEDAFYGVTIVINHGQGYKSSYSNLDNDIFVKVGQSVKKSQKLGKIGATSIGEIKDVPHLHFMLYENNEIADPSSIFK